MKKVTSLMPINFRSLQNRNFLVFLLSLIISVSAVLAVTLQQTYYHSNQQLEGQFSASRAVLFYKLEKDALALRRGLNTASKDFAIKQLIAGATQDPESLQLALNNYQSRLNSDFMAVFNKQKQLLTGTDNFNFDHFINSAAADQQLNFKFQDNELYLIVYHDVKFNENVPTPDAFLLTGVKLSRLVSSSLKTITNFDVSIQYKQAVVATSLIDIELNTLSTGFKDLVQTNTNLSHDLRSSQSKSEPKTMLVGQQELVYYQAELGRIDNNIITVFFTLPETMAHINYQNLILQLSVTITLVMLLVSFLTFSFSRSIAKPLRALAQVANEIRQGKYPTIDHDTRLSEVESLSFALSGMQDAIQKREQENHQLAFYSQLTQLPNRTYFLKYLREQLAQVNVGPFAVLWMDVDRFKDINDTLGHEFGDKVLTQISQRLDQNKAANVFLAYLDGDEFAALIPVTTPTDSALVAEQFAHLFNLPFTVDDISLDVSISIGVSTFPTHAQFAEQLMQYADIALYEAKTQHHSVEEYKASDNKYSVVRLSLMTELRNAIENQQLNLFYQPKIDIKTGRISSVECLVRWQHPEHGFIFPDDFIPLAEQTGNIRYLTKWAIETALIQQQRLLNLGFNLKMAVNISTVDLIDLNLPPYVAQLLAKYDIKPQMLTLEVTESSIMSDPENAITALSMLKNMGINLSIDDFGTGYSSMEQLKRTPVNELKIDKSFVLELANSPDDIIIVKSITNLAHNLGLSIVAEGVENILSLQKLAELEVETAQGYFISKPLPATDLEQWLTANKGIFEVELEHNDE